MGVDGVGMEIARNSFNVTAFKDLGRLIGEGRVWNTTEQL